MASKEYDHSFVCRYYPSFEKYQLIGLLYLFETDQSFECRNRFPGVKKGKQPVATCP
tara:strand:+ start:308 stop:478 length:171 start_codon:yes stop_codon:yes gene_type:complete